MVIAHNMMAMNAQRQFNIVGNSKKKSTEKLSSGYRINRAADDAAGLSISEKMRRQIRGLNQGARNTMDGISLLQVADGALAEVHDMLHRVTELSVQSANGTNTDSDREAIQQEINQIMSEINRISDTTEFNGRKLFTSISIADETETLAPSPIIPGSPSPSIPPAPVDYVTPIQSSFKVLGTPIGLSAGTKSISASASAITIDGTSNDWSIFKNASNISLDKSNVAAGSYNLDYKGLSLAITVADGATIDDIVTALDGASFDISSLSKEITPVVAKSISVSKGTNTNELLKIHSPISQASQTCQTTFLTDDNGITLMHYNYANRGYTEKVGYVSWADMGLSTGSPLGGTYTLSDSSSGLNITFDVTAGTTLDDLKKSLNYSIFDVTFDDGGKFTTRGSNISKTEIASANKINATDLSIKHSIAAADDFYKELGYTNPADILGGIDVEASLTNENGILQLKISSNGHELISSMNTREYDGDYYIAEFGGFSNSIFTLDIGLPNAGKSSTSKEKYMNDFLNNNGNTVKIADIHVDDFYDYRFYGIKTVSHTTYNVKNIKTKDYIPPSSPTPTDPVTPPSDEPDPPVKPKPDNVNLELWIQSGAEVGDGMYISIGVMDTDALGINALDVTTVDGANNAIDAVKTASEMISSLRSNIGAQQNRLEHTYKNVTNTAENTTAAESLIRDTDIAKEMVEFSKQNILEQVGQSMMAQANQRNQSVLSLLQ